MKKHKYLIAFFLFLALIFSLSVSAYASTYSIGARALTNVLFYNQAGYTWYQSKAQFNTNDIFRVSSQVFGLDNELWYYGVADPTSNPYTAVADEPGYSRVYGLDGSDLWTFSLAY